MWNARFFGLLFGISVQIGPIVADTLPQDAGVRSKEMLARAQSQANRRSAGDLLDHIEAQRRKVDLQEAAKIMPPVSGDMSGSEPASAERGVEAAGTR